MVQMNLFTNSNRLTDLENLWLPKEKHGEGEGIGILD